MTLLKDVIDNSKSTQLKSISSCVNSILSLDYNFLERFNNTRWGREIMPVINCIVENTNKIRPNSVYRSVHKQNCVLPKKFFSAYVSLTQPTKNWSGIESTAPPYLKANNLQNNK